MHILLCKMCCPDSLHIKYFFWHEIWKYLVWYRSCPLWNVFSLHGQQDKTFMWHFIWVTMWCDWKMILIKNITFIKCCYLLGQNVLLLILLSFLYYSPPYSFFQCYSMYQLSKLFGCKTQIQWSSFWSTSDLWRF